MKTIIASILLGLLGYVALSYAEKTERIECVPGDFSDTCVGADMDGLGGWQPIEAEGKE